MAEHTPTPWHVGGRWFVLANVDGIYIAELMKPLEGETDRRGANAEHIVRACNAFDELVQAARDVLERNGRHEAPLRSYAYCAECYAAAEPDDPLEHTDECSFGRIAALLRQLGEGGA